MHELCYEVFLLFKLQLVLFACGNDVFVDLRTTFRDHFIVIITLPWPNDFGLIEIDIRSPCYSFLPNFELSFLSCTNSVKLLKFDFVSIKILSYLHIFELHDVSGEGARFVRENVPNLS